MANWLWFGKTHTAVFRLTGGRVGARLAGINMVFLDSIGRKSGLVRTSPIACYPYKDSVAVVASNNGTDNDPMWWKNLQANPEAEIQLGRQRYKVRAEEITGVEREVFWPKIVQINPAQARYQRQTKRLLPVVYLKKV